MCGFYFSTVGRLIYDCLSLSLQSLKSQKTSHLISWRHIFQLDFWESGPWTRSPHSEVVGVNANGFSSFCVLKHMRVSSGQHNLLALCNKTCRCVSSLMCLTLTVCLSSWVLFKKHHLNYGTQTERLKAPVNPLHSIHTHTDTHTTSMRSAEYSPFMHTYTFNFWHLNTQH